MTAKIATCCYCGTRAALVLVGKTRHELACRSCGAPLSQMKLLKTDHPQDRHLVGRPRLHKAATTDRKRKGLLRRAWDEIEDAVEDIFD